MLNKKMLCIIIRMNFQLLLLLCIITVVAFAQDEKPPLLSIRDPAPPLRVKEWLKGEPVQRFEKGRIYIVEFWATWCAPCKAAMPHLSDLAHQYKDRVTIIGMDVMEKKATTMEKIKAFVDSMGYRMDYTVAVEDSNFMERNWLDASGERGIPKSFVVNADGILAWMGHPHKLNIILPQIVNNTWDIKRAFVQQNSNRYLAALDDSVSYELRYYRGDRRLNPNTPLRSDSDLLAMIDEIVKKEPKLKYTPHIAFYTIGALLETDLQKAYEYGKVAIVTPTYQEPVYHIISDAITFYSTKLRLPVEICRLGAQAYQAEIDSVIYPELINVPKLYYNMAGCYWFAGDKAKAIEALQTAIKMLKGKKNFSKADLAVYKSRLQQYKKKPQ